MYTQDNVYNMQNVVNNPNLASGNQYYTSGYNLQGSSNYIPYTSPNYQYFPHFTYQGNYYTTSSEVKIEQVENGWLIIKGGKCYIATSKEEIIKYL